MPSFLRFVFCATVASVALAFTTTATATAAATCADAGLTPRSDNVERIEAATLCLLNAERAKHDLSRLRANERLAKAAQAYSAKMVSQRFFSHVCPEGSTLKSRLRSAKYVNKAVRDYVLGENLAWGSGRLSTPKSIVRGWMKSDAHRHAILNPSFRDVGVGVVPGAPASVSGRAATYTAEFGYRTTS